MCGASKVHCATWPAFVVELIPLTSAQSNYSVQTLLLRPSLPPVILPDRYYCDWCGMRHVGGGCDDSAPLVEPDELKLSDKRRRCNECHDAPTDDAADSGSGQKKKRKTKKTPSSEESAEEGGGEQEDAELPPKKKKKKTAKGVTPLGVEDQKLRGGGSAFQQSMWVYLPLHACGRICCVAAAVLDILRQHAHSSLPFVLPAICGCGMSVYGYPPMPILHSLNSTAPACIECLHQSNLAHLSKVFVLCGLEDPLPSVRLSWLVC